MGNKETIELSELKREIKELENRLIKVESIISKHVITDNIDHAHIVRNDTGTIPNELKRQSLPKKEFNKQQSNRPTTTEAQPKKTRRKMDLETGMGKYMAGAMASILIIIAGISLVTLVWGTLTNETRVLILAISGLLTAAIGLFTMDKGHRVPGSILLGTGLSLILLTILTANIVFGMISPKLSLILMFLWFIGVLYISNKQETMFTQVIAYMGSLIVITENAFETVNPMDYILLLSVVTAIIVAIYYTNKDNESNINKLISISTGLLIALTLPYATLWGSGIVVKEIAIPLLISLGLIYMVLNYLYNTIEKDLYISNTVHLISIILTSIITMTILDEINITNAYAAIIAIIIFTSQYVYAEFKIEGDTDGITYPVIAFLSFSILALIGELTHIYIGLTLLILLIMHVQNKTNGYYKWGVINTLAITEVILLTGNGIGLVASNTPYIIEIVTTATGIILLVITLVCISMELRKDYDNVNKVASTLTVLLATAFLPTTLIRILSKNDLPDQLYYIIPQISIILVMLTGYFSEWGGRSNKQWFTDLKLGNNYRTDMVEVYNHIIYLTGLLAIVNIDDPISVFITFLIMVLSISINLYLNLNNIDRLDYMGPMYGLKYLILIWTMLGSMLDIGIASPLISLSGLAIALICIIIGFKYRIVSIRFYGLILTIAMVLKFILVDMNQSNSLARVLALLIGGIICLIISIIYNKISKDMEQLE